MTTAHLDIRPAPWADDAACASTSPDVFFPDKGESSAAAKAICHTCPVIGACYAATQEIKPQFGIWAGMSVRQLTAARKQERATA